MRLARAGAALLLALGLGAVPAARGEATAADPARESVRRFWAVMGRATERRVARDFAGAAVAYEEALVLQPTHEDALYYLGYCRRELADFAAARAAYERLVRANPDSARGHAALGALLASVESGAPLDLAAAEVHLRRAHDINAEETGPMLRLGEVLLAAGRRDEARRWLESAARTNPRSVEAALLAGYLYWSTGDRAAARDWYARAATAAAGDRPVRGVLGEGDRRAAPAAGPSPGTVPPAGVAPARVAAPPLREPHGSTLFGAHAAALRERVLEAVEPASLPEAELDRVYRPVDATARALLARSAARPTSRR